MSISSARLTVPGQTTKVIESAARANVGAKDVSAASISLGPLGERLGYVMRRAQIAIFEDFIATCANADIRPGQYSALTIIDCNPGLSQAQVAAALGIKAPNFAGMLDGLEGRGLVERQPMVGDKRRHALVLTREGRRLLTRLHKLAGVHEQRLIDRVGSNAHEAMFGWLAAIAGLGDDTARKTRAK